MKARRTGSKSGHLIQIFWVSELELFLFWRQSIRCFPLGLGHQLFVRTFNSVVSSLLVSIPTSCPGANSHLSHMLFLVCLIKLSFDVGCNFTCGPNIEKLSDSSS